MKPTLLYDQLAFSSTVPTGHTEEESDGNLVKAVARSPLTISHEYGGKIVLNVELFGSGWIAPSRLEEQQQLPRDHIVESTSFNVLLFVPGVCESAETWTVQHLARSCLDNDWHLAVLELPGHGLSSGPKALLRPTGRAGLNRLVDMVVLFARHVVDIIGTTVFPEQLPNKNASKPSVRLVLSGASLGGVLAAYATPKIAQAIHGLPSQHTVSMNPSTSTTTSAVNCVQWDNFRSLQFVGNFLLSPAVGVAPQAVPPPVIVSALSCLAFVAPSVSFMTPTEDPSHYNCPSWTTRNFQGQWPLGTSKLLLDITTTIVPSDVERVTSDNPECSPFYPAGDQRFEITILAGRKDPVVPIEAIQIFVNAINTNNQSQATLIEFSKGDHGLLAQAKGTIVQETLDRVNETLAKYSSVT